MESTEVAVGWLKGLLRWADWVKNNPDDLPILLGYIESIAHLTKDTKGDKNE